MSLITGRRPQFLLIAGLAVPLALIGCSNSDNTASEAGTSPPPAMATTAASSSASAAPLASPGPDANTNPDATADAESSNEPSEQAPIPTCSGLTGAQAVSTWGDQVPSYGSDLGWQWNLDGADTSSYDGCAALSWVVLELNASTASSPFQIMLFHYGQYIGVTSAEPIAFWPEVIRLDDETIQVTYSWTRDGEPNAAPSGRSVSYFAWDETAGRVIHSGEWPPEVAG